MSYSDMQTRQQRYFERKVTEGYKQVTFMLSAAGISELDRRAAKAASRLKAAQKWLRPRKPLFDLENMTSTFADFVRIEHLQASEAERENVRNAARLIFEEVYRRFHTTLINPRGWVTAYK